MGRTRHELLSARGRFESTVSIERPLRIRTISYLVMARLQETVRFTSSTKSPNLVFPTIHTQKS